MSHEYKYTHSRARDTSLRAFQALFAPLGMISRIKDASYHKQRQHCFGTFRPWLREPEALRVFESHR